MEDDRTESEIARENLDLLLRGDFSDEDARFFIDALVAATAKDLQAENRRLREDLESRRELGRIDQKRIAKLEAAVGEGHTKDCMCGYDLAEDRPDPEFTAESCRLWRAAVLGRETP